MRKSLTRRLSRLSEQSHQSHISGVLDPDSNIGIDDEGAPLWFKDLEEGNTSGRRSGRFSILQHDSPLLDSDSSPDSTPQRKSWWKELEQSTEPRNISSDVVGERKIIASDKSHESMELSDVSLEKAAGIEKQKSTLRRGKRRSTSKAMFSLISESSEDSIRGEKADSDTRERDKQASTSALSISGGDDSVAKIRKLPFKKKTAASKDLPNPKQQSDENPPDSFQHAIDILRWSVDDQDEATTPNSPQNSLGNRESSVAGSANNAETIRLELKDRSSKNPTNLFDESEDTAALEEKDDDAESLKLRIKPRSKKRTILAGTRKRKSPNFEELLNNVSEDESSEEDQIGEENYESNGNLAGQRFSRGFSPQIDMRSMISEDESEEEDNNSIRKERAGFFHKKRKTSLDKTAEQSLESLNISNQRESINISKEIEKINTPQPKQETTSQDTEERSMNRDIDRSSTSRFSNAEAAAKNIQSKSKTSLARGVGVDNDYNTAKLSAKDKSHRANSSGSSSAELEEEDEKEKEEEEEDEKEEEEEEVSRRTLRLQFRRSTTIEKKRSSVRERGNSSRQLRSSEERSGEQAEHTARENSGIFMQEASPTVENEEETIDGENLPSTSGFRDQQYTRRSELGPQDVDIADKPNSDMPPDSAGEKTDRKKTRTSTMNKSVVSQQHREKTFEESRAADRDFKNKENRSRGTKDIANRESVDSSFVTGSSERNNSIQRDDRPSQIILFGNASNAEKQSKIRAALEEVKKKEFAQMKNAKIDSYFKPISKTKSDAPVQSSQKSQNKIGPQGKNNNKKSPARSDKAYLVNGKIYKKPKLPRPKPWATDRLYKFLWKQMEPKYKLNTRVRSEKFITNLSETVSIVTRRKKYENYKEELGDLIREMARLDLIKTRNDFNIFCQDFLPYEFRIKVVPMLLPGNVRNIPFNPDELHKPILET